MQADANQVMVEGVVTRKPDCRRTPAGIPICRFTLEHHSERSEAGYLREVRFRIGVVVTGEALAPAAARLRAGDRLRIEGFLNRSGYQDGEARLLLHADQIEDLNENSGLATNT